jgi:uncharacterized protein YdaU (DUF1376 family)
MGKAPAFQFYASDFLSDMKVATMSMEERGVYITLLSYAWLENGLPPVEQKLARLCGNPENWEAIWEVVSECFYTDDDNKLKNAKMEEIRETLTSYKQKMSEAGKKGMEARWKNNQVKARLKQSYNSSSPTSTTTSNTHIKAKDKIDWVEFMNKWNSICGHNLPQIKKLTDSRKRAIRKFIKQDVDVTAFFLRVSDSSFLSGVSENSSWIADFDWVLKESNYIKILEGVYDDKKEKKKEKKKNTPVICSECSYKFITIEPQLTKLKCEKCGEYGVISQNEYNYIYNKK